MHFSTFFTAMEVAEHQMLRDLGMSVMHPYKDGMISWPRVSATCDYRSPLRFEEVVDIDITITKIGTKSVEYTFEFSREGTAIATGKLVAVCCFFNESQPSETVQSVAIPDEIRELLAKHAK